MTEQTALETATPEDQHCLVEKRGHVLIVTMNRPEARTRCPAPMLAGMTAALGPGRLRPGHPGLRSSPVPAAPSAPAPTSRR